MTTLVNPFRFGGPGYATPALVQSNYNTVASGAATATISAATAGNLLVAVVADGTTTPSVAGGGWTTIGSVGTGSARSVLLAKTAAGGETSESTTGAAVNESIFLAEFSGVTSTLTGTPTTAVDAGAGVNTLAMGSVTAAVPGLAFAHVATSGSLTAPSWTTGGLTILTGTRVQLGYLATPAGVLSAALTWTGTTRRASGALAIFAAKTL